MQISRTSTHESPKRIHKVQSKGKTYYYAWRSGPRLTGEPGSTEFKNSYDEAIQSLKAADHTRFGSLITRYKGSEDYKGLSNTTKRNWGPWLDRIREHFGELRTAQFSRIEKIRPEIIRWRAQYAHARRSADFGLQVLSRVLSYGIDPCAEIATNPCDGVRRLYQNDRSTVIWEDADIARIKAATHEQMGWAIDLASLTGLRRGDLVKLSWSHIDENAIRLQTSKSRMKRTATIPLYDDLRLLLDRIPKRAAAVLTNSYGKPWKDGPSLGVSFCNAKVAAKMQDEDLHFHDLRGTAATKFYNAQIPIRVIAEIMAWNEESVERIIRKYVGRDSATKAFIEQINEHRTNTVKPAVKPFSENDPSA